MPEAICFLASPLASLLARNPPDISLRRPSLAVARLQRGLAISPFQLPFAQEVPNNNELVLDIPDETNRIAVILQTDGVSIPYGEELGRNLLLRICPL